MKPQEVIELLTEEKDETNLCVILRSGPDGLETLLVADELGRWSISGGHAKGNETNAQAAQREVKEETGLDVEPQPLLWAYHAARKKSSPLFYAITDQVETKPGGGDVTDCRWVKLSQLGDLNGTDRLAIHVAANRVHSPQAVVNDAVEVAENQGYAVATVAAPPAPTPGIYFRINGIGAETFAKTVSDWAESLKYPTTVIVTKPYASTEDALQRASRCRKLTPMMEAILHVADALWRYESAVAPALAQGRIVLEFGPEIAAQRLLERGLSDDLWKDLEQRIPKPVAMFNVGEDFALTDLQAIKDSIEGMKVPEEEPRRYLDQLTPRQMDVPWTLEVVRENPDEFDNPIVRCPKCKHEGPLLQDFSYLKAGFNGIEAGEPDDLDAQECGRCAAKLEWGDVAKWMHPVR